VDEHTDNLTLARQAYAAQDWATAAAHFDVVATDRLTADDLAAHADAAWWLGRIEDNLRLGAAACDAFQADSRPAEAALAALRLGLFHLARGDEPQSMGWIGRAGRLAEGIPECPVHGYLRWFTEVELGLLTGQPAAAVEAARRVQDLGRRFDEPDLVAVGLHGEGRALIKSGHVVDGLALVDEAMVTVLDGRLSPLWSGNLYCHTIAACHEVADVRRMTRWTDLAERWLTTFPAAVVFGGLCGVHRAQLLLLRGEWDEDWRGWWGEEPPYHAPVFVLTHHPEDATPADRVTFLTCNPAEAVRIGLAAAAGKNLEVFSPTIGRQLLELGLIDEIDLHIAPILLGEGIRLYNDPGGEPVHLRRVGAGDPASAVNVRYRPTTTAKIATERVSGN